MYRALLICNSVYPLAPSHLPQLLGPVQDGLALWSALTDSERGGLFAPENVEVLFEREKDEVLRTANRFFQECEPDDVLLFYYSGHGKPGRSNLHLCARDTDLVLLASTSVSGNELKSYMETSYAQSIIVILDCCHAGAFKGDPPQISPAPLAGKGRFVMTASGAAQRAADAESAGSPSPFTHALVEALRNAEPRHSGEVTLSVDDVYDYAVKALPKELPSPQRRVNGAGDATIAKRFGRSRQSEEAAAAPGVAPPQAGPWEQAAPAGPPAWLRGMGFAGAGARRTDPSVGDLAAWRVFLLSSGLLGLISFYAWRAWMDQVAKGFSAAYSRDTELFFLLCGILAAVSALSCLAGPLTPPDSNWSRRARNLRFLNGLALGVLWFYSVVQLGLNSPEQGLLQSSMMFLCIAALSEKRHDSPLLAGAVVAFAGVVVPDENGGYYEFDVIPVFLAIICAALVVMWFFGAPEQFFVGAATAGLASVGTTYLIHGFLPSVSLYGTALVLLSAAFGHGVRPAEGSASLVQRRWRAVQEGIERQTRTSFPRLRRRS